MKKLFASLLCFGLLQQSAYALPGWNSQQIKSWVKTHKFLSPDYNDANILLAAERKLSGGKKLNVLYGGSVVGRESPYPLVIIYVETPQKDQFKNNIKLKLWQRNSEDAAKILANIYNTEIANDFKNSAFVFSGQDFFSDCLSGMVERDKNPTDCQLEMYDAGKFRLFKGQKYGYEVNEDETELKIFPLDRINTWIDVERHNRKMYEKFKQVDDRRKPADLGL